MSFGLKIEYTERDFTATMSIDAEVTVISVNTYNNAAESVITINGHTVATNEIESVYTKALDEIQKKVISNVAEWMQKCTLVTSK